MATKIRMESVQPAGVGDLAWHPDGTRVVLGGAGSTLQLRRVGGATEGTEAAAATTTHRARTGTAVVALAVHPAGTQLCVAGADRTVALYDVPALDREAQLCTARAPVVQLAFSPTGSFVAVADAAGTVSLVSTTPGTPPMRCPYPRNDSGDDNEMEEQDEGEEETPGVLGIAFDPQNDFVAALYADGTFAAFRTADGTCACVLHDLMENGTEDKHQQQRRCVPAWRGDGGLIALPTGRAVTFVAPKRGRAAAGPWEAYANAEFGEGVRHALSCCAWSPNGRYLAVGAAADGAVLVWDMRGGSGSGSGAPTSIAKTTVRQAPLLACCWAPGANALAVLDAGGNAGVWEDVVPRFMPSPLVATGDAAAGATPRKAPTIVVNPKDLFAPLPKQPQQQQKEKEEKEKQEDENGFDGAASTATETETETTTKATTTTAKRKNEIELQGAMQPNASPMGRLRRFLAFNSSASLVVGEQDGESVFVLERSGDHGVQHRQIINNNSGCTMGALCPSGFVAASTSTVVFTAAGESKTSSTAKAKAAATEEEEEEREPACDWSRELPEDEGVVGVAANGTGVCVATTRGFLRLFSLTGMQRAIVSTGGAHVCCVGRGPLFAAIAQDARTGAYACQAFAVDAAGTPRARFSCPVPLAPGTQLAWAGLSDALALCVLDTRGLLQMRLESGDNNNQAALWVPILDLASVPHWVVDVCGTEAFFVRLRAGETCPATAPPPLVDTLPLTPPAVEEPGAAATALVVQLMRDRALLAHRVAVGAVASAAVPRAAAQLDVLQIQLVAALARSPPSPAREPRILALCRALALRRSLLIAAKFVNAAGLSRLAGTIADMYEAAAGGDGDDGNGEDDGDQQSGTKRPSPDGASASVAPPAASPLARKKPRT